MKDGRGGRPTRAKPLPSHPGNVYRPFAELMQLETIDGDTFRSIAPPFAPGGPVGVGRSYGAHVYAQAAYAASKTVDKGFLLHHVSGNFILAGELAVPFVYRVQSIRNGKSYCTRAVNVTQSEGNGICFTCICSFKTAEPSHVEAQRELDIWREYAVVLKDRLPHDFQEVPGMDLPFYWQRRKETGENDKFPGLQCHKVDMSRYNKDKHPIDRRQLIFYRTIGDMPADPNLHLAAHLYSSDRNSLYIVANNYGVGDYWTQMSSLCHTVIFHSPMEALLFKPSSGQQSELNDPTGRWFAFEGGGDRMGSGRAVFNCRLWNNEGIHVATAVQDGLLRFTKRIDASPEEEQEIERIMRGWGPRSKL
ncbi:hypothetical protein M409DRAFT_66413 [Zasmidium cellare ATCC 36951]|uniref:Thioesterase/thiol ester dehydrase-isomerase n=1 Tax=Zasmidium cellare ATCC 36951 TaxID=1080233 RepID=A0A6A6CI16_ZASCE|nr:uncharacterized protein M409DRAFT_66413 [Zasmidium cellare ATCC 36951]KAF2166864.1 hypothetical protein M409DRAFT_66413 [Zasmidium cellare ATCC 36951]